MKITYDPGKRGATLADRGLDFADAGMVFAGVTLDAEDDHADYGDVRMISVGACSDEW